MGVPTATRIPIPPPACQRSCVLRANSLAVTLPGGELHAVTKKQDQKGWKARQEKLSAGRGQKQNRPRGHRHTRDDL
jgi:hypothetical protein